jgi:hypothetical protein
MSFQCDGYSSHTSESRGCKTVPPIALGHLPSFNRKPRIPRIVRLCQATGGMTRLSQSSADDCIETLQTGTRPYPDAARTMALPRLRAAVCHVSPHVLSAARTTQKTIDCIKLVAEQSANLVVFPESAIPGFPVWSSLLAPTQTHHFFQRMVQESVYIDGDEISEIRQAARNARVIVSLGISEKVRYSAATLFNSNVIIGDEGEVLVHHRKLSKLLLCVNSAMVRSDVCPSSRRIPFYCARTAFDVL